MLALFLTLSIDIFQCFCFFSCPSKVARLSNFETSTSVPSDALDWLPNCLMEDLEALCVKVSTDEELEPVWGVFLSLFF